MKHALRLGLVAGLAAVALPFSSPADAAGHATGRHAAGTPAHRLDLEIRRLHTHWVGKNVYGPPISQQVRGRVRATPGRAVALIRVTNTGTKRTSLDLSASSIRDTFYGGANWPSEDSLAPGESVRFAYVVHRGTAKDGDSVQVDISTPDDAVSFVVKASAPHGS